jgi:hypothetical protein
LRFTADTSCAASSCVPPIADGASAIRTFIDELIARGHACREVFREDRHLFRLQSKVIY